MSCVHAETESRVLSQGSLFWSFFRPFLGKRPPLEWREKRQESLLLLVLCPESSICKIPEMDHLAVAQGQDVNKGGHERRSAYFSFAPEFT
jgi:hypothetical protein